MYHVLYVISSMCFLSCVYLEILACTLIQGGVSGMVTPCRKAWQPAVHFLFLQEKAPDHIDSGEHGGFLKDQFSALRISLPCPTIFYD